MADDRLPVVVVGAGLGGLVTALELAPHPVLLLSRAPLGLELATAWAQGGIAAAVAADDAPSLHAADTHAAGDGLCDPGVVDLVTREAPACIDWLGRYGVRFDRDASGRLALGREGGHCRRRIVHARDATGDAIVRALVGAVRRCASITLLEGVEARELLAADGGVVGVAALRGHERLVVAAEAVVMATGGVGALYRYTSNPLGARGQGLVMAARAGARLADLEFVQFHPTAIDVEADPLPLATEALRGEGALLVNSLGERFMEGAHPLAELAPRDIVARAIFRERASGRGAFLDAREALGSAFGERFPTVHAACSKAGLDPANELIPVTPAAHYHMGGIAVDTNGRSSLEGLWAVGEVASTGLHGGNRLASNSLLEATVFGIRSARDVAGRARRPLRRGRLAAMACASPPAADWKTLSAVRATMERNVGVIRDERLLRQSIGLLDEVRELNPPGPVGDAATAGLMIAVAALGRRESRGGHYRADFPSSDSTLSRRSDLTLAEAGQVAAGIRDGDSRAAVALAAAG